MDYKKNKLVIISLLIAFIGGVPGFFSIVDSINNYFKKPVFHYVLDNMLVGNGTMENNMQASYIILFGSITNLGDEVLLPHNYSMSVEVDNKWIDLEPALVYKYITLPDGRKIGLEKAREMDLQKSVSKIQPNDVIYGSLMFTSEKLNLFDLYSDKVIRLRLTCVDNSNNSYHANIESKGEKTLKPGVIPKYGVQIPELENETYNNGPNE